MLTFLKDVTEGTLAGVELVPIQALHKCDRHLYQPCKKCKQMENIGKV